MNRINQTLVINASPSKVYKALSTQSGVKAWWTEHTELDEHEGGEGTFGFPDHNVKKTVTVTSLKPNQQVSWKVIKHECSSPDWKGTTIDFNLEPCEGGTVLQFDHCGWPDASPIYSTCVNGWSHFMNSLKLLLEEGKGTPFVSEARG